MKKPRCGVTEEFWRYASAEFKLLWSFLTKSMAGLAGLVLVNKTGYFWIDAIVGVLTGGLPLLVIATQRDLSRYKPYWRNWITRTSIGGTVNSVTLLGLAVYLAIVFPLFHAVEPLLPTFFAATATPYGIATCLMTAIPIGALCVAAFNVFRGLDIERMIHHQPKRGLLMLLVRQRFLAGDVHRFATFELGVIGASLMYGSLAAAAAEIAFTAPTGG